MILLDGDQLAFTFPDHAPEARLTVEFQRTLRVPDTGKTYDLPPGLGRFPVRHLDDYADRLPAEWRPRGGVMVPMWQAEALWIMFRQAGFGGYPFAVKVAAGKINAVTGEAWRQALNRDPQDYLVAPEQPWLDGFCVGKGVVRQFVAMPLGDGYTAEEQVTGEATWGGLQISVTPIKAEIWERLGHEQSRDRFEVLAFAPMPAVSERRARAVGLAPGGRMRQHIYPDRHPLDAWDQRATRRVFVTLLDALSWRDVTGEAPVQPPPSARDYAKAGLPWFAWYGEDAKALQGGATLAGLKSVASLFKAKSGTALPESDDIATPPPVPLGPGSRQPRPVREGALGR